MKRFFIKGTSFLPVSLTGASRSSSHLRPSCQVNSWCSCAIDTQPASDWLCDLGADVGSVTGLCQQRVLIRTDYSRLVSEEFFSFSLFSSSLALSPSSASEHTFWKDVPRSFFDVVLFSAHFEAFFKTLSFTWLGIPQIQLFLCWLISMEENSAFLSDKQEHGDTQSLFNVALPPETK